VGIIAAAVVIRAAVVLLVRVESTGVSERVAPAERSIAGQSSRVRDRLKKLRARYQRRGRKELKKKAAERPAAVLSALAPTVAATPAEGDEDSAHEIAQIENTLLNDPDPDERISAVFDASTLDDDREAVRILSAAMGDPDAEVRLSVVETLGDYTELLTVDLLSPALNDSDPEVRLEAVDILGDMETPEALAAVHAALNDPDEDVRDLAQEIVESAED